MFSIKFLETTASFSINNLQTLSTSVESTPFYKSNIFSKNNRAVTRSQPYFATIFIIISCQIFVNQKAPLFMGMCKQMILAIFLVSSAF